LAPVRAQRQLRFASSPCSTVPPAVPLALDKEKRVTANLL
jgi:hypothetical protein